MSYFEGRTAVLGTMHGKEEVLKPILEKHLGIRLILPEQFDSDQFGTFTRDMQRAGNQLEAARLKVRAAMRLTGIDLGIASEGSFGVDPDIPFIRSNLELLLLIDEKNEFEIKGHHRSSDTNIAGQYVANFEEALAFAQRVGFPLHAVVVRQSEESKKPIYKGIRTEEDLKHSVTELLSRLFTRRVYIETDMRAHMNPTRMDKIAKAAENLVANIACKCPRCDAPGFVVTKTKQGLVCSSCQLPTHSVMSYTHTCQKCALEMEFPREDKLFEDPQMCSRCNP